MLSKLAQRCFVLALLLATPVHGETAITHGPILGRPGSDTMSVWVRTSQPGKVQVRYGTARDSLDSLSDVVTTRIDHDNTGVVTLRGLQARTKYFYEAFVPGGAAAPGGSFRTFPDARQLVDEQHNPHGLFNFRFEFACGNNQNPNDGGGPSLPTYDTLLRQVRHKVDFAILNGDWLYEEQREYSVQQWRKKVQLGDGALPRIVDLAPSITGVWENYKLYLRRAANLAEWHRHVPSFYTYDDHETLNDIYGTATAGFRDRRAVFRDIGVRAWFDYLAWANPVQHATPAYFGIAQLTEGSDVLTDRKANFTLLPREDLSNLHIHWGGSQAGILKPEPDPSEANANHGVYDLLDLMDQQRLRIRPAAIASNSASYSIGRRCYGHFRVANCDFYLLDTRSHRDLHDVEQPDKPGLSMLGSQQAQWLMDSMREAPGDFAFVVSSVNLMVPHVGAGGGADLNKAAAKDDAWTVFLEEREKLIRFWDSLGKPVFVLTGDLHNSFAIKITDNVWEFASGPHNSVNHRPIEDEGGRPANGRFQYGPRPCEIRWSTYVLSDIPRPNRLFPQYCVVQVNNVFNNPIERDGERLVAYPRPHVIFQYFDGRTGDLQYAETIHAIR